MVVLCSGDDRSIGIMVRKNIVCELGPKSSRLHESGCYGKDLQMSGVPGQRRIRRTGTHFSENKTDFRRKSWSDKRGKREGGRGEGEKGKRGILTPVSPF